MNGIFENMQSQFRELKMTAIMRWRHEKARRHRRRLQDMKLIGVVGSSGKTTTKEMTAAVLSSAYRVHKTQGNDNLVTESGPEHTILAAQLDDEFLVLEAGVDGPGQMQKLGRLMQPDLAVMLCVKPAHVRGFGTLEAIAEEKGLVFDHLSADGVGVVNGDDPLVMQQAQQRDIKLRTFGMGSDCDVRLVSAESRWPERLQVVARIDGHDHTIQTRLMGTHWTNSVLAALAVGTHYGLSVDQCAAAIGTVEPFWSRMQPCELSNGVVVVRDDVHGEKFNYEIAFDAFREATAPRKVLLASTYASAEPLRDRMEALGRHAAEIFDYAIFIGERGNYAKRAAKEAGMASDNMVAFYKYQDAVEHIRSELRAGDLVLLKGRMDMHLARLYLSLLGDVECTRKSCHLTWLCDGCPKLGLSARDEVSGPIAPPPRQQSRSG